MNHWMLFDGVNLPPWMGEGDGKLVCSFLNHYVPKEYSMKGTRYHLLNRGGYDDSDIYQHGPLYFHLLNRPKDV